jgi:hypothetical protein
MVLWWKAFLLRHWQDLTLRHLSLWQDMMLQWVLWNLTDL